jgi:hypothetical protein
MGKYYTIPSNDSLLQISQLGSRHLGSDDEVDLCRRRLLDRFLIERISGTLDTDIGVLGLTDA